MRITRAFTVLLLAGALAIAATAPAAARSAGKASGDLTWDGQYDIATGVAKRPGRHSVFSVRDGAPGKDSRRGDRGWYRFSERNDRYDQRLVMSVRCVRVNGDWAEFAGVITEATGNFNVGNVFLVSVLDLDTPEPNDLHIGMKSYADLDDACDAALDAEQFGRKGRYTGGRLDVRVR